MEDMGGSLQLRSQTYRRLYGGLAKDATQRPAPAGSALDYKAITPKRRAHLQQQFVDFTIRGRRCTSLQQVADALLFRNRPLKRRRIPALQCELRLLNRSQQIEEAASVVRLARSFGRTQRVSLAFSMVSIMADAIPVAFTSYVPLSIVFLSAATRSCRISSSMFTLLIVFESHDSIAVTPSVSSREMCLVPAACAGELSCNEPIAVNVLLSILISCPHTILTCN
jgi:hypothetical protein